MTLMHSQTPQASSSAASPGAFQPERTWTARPKIPPEWQAHMAKAEAYFRAYGIDLYSQETADDLEQFDQTLREIRRERRREVHAGYQYVQRPHEAGAPRLDESPVDEAARV